MRWVGPAGSREIRQAASGEPLPLASLEAPCLFRTAATNALDRANMPWRSPSSVRVSAACGLPRRPGSASPSARRSALPASVRALAPGEAGLPALPSLGLVLHRAEADPGPATARLAAIILQALRDAMPEYCKVAGNGANVAALVDAG